MEASMLLWFQICLIVSAISSTAFPLLYAFSPWYRSHLGRSLMGVGVSLALAIDFTLLFYIWQPTSIVFQYWVNLTVFTLLAFSTTGLTIMMIRNNYKVYRKNHPHDHSQ